MADIKFSCPHCQRHIQAGPEYGGLQINCPSCNGPIIIPGAPIAAPQPVAIAAPPPMVAAACPSCAAPVAPAAVLCTSCGYNLRTGQRAPAPTAVAKKPTDPWEIPWYKTAWPYLGVLVAILGLFYWLGQNNPKYMLAFLATAVVYTLVTHVCVVVVAFKESIGTGFLAMCIPIYALYFMIKSEDYPTLKALYTVAALLNLALRFIT